MPERPVPPHDHTRFSRGGKLTSAAIVTLSSGSSGGDGGNSGSSITDHGDLAGLLDDDHTQYRLDTSWFDVTRYGAVADSSTDCTAAFAAADAAAAAVRGVVYIPGAAGSYYVRFSGRHALVPSEGVTWQGDGMFESIIELDPGSTVSDPGGDHALMVIDIGSATAGVSNVTLRDFTVIGHYSTLGSGTKIIEGIAARQNTTTTAHSDDVLIERVRVMDTNVGIHCAKVVASAPSDTAYRHKRWTVRGCIIDTTNNKGIEIQMAEDALIADNMLFDVTDGIQFLHYTVRSAITGNRIEYINGGINVREGSSDVLVEGNILTALGGASTTLSDLPTGIAFGTEDVTAGVQQARVVVRDNIINDTASTLKIGLMFTSYASNSGAAATDFLIQSNVFNTNRVYMTDPNFPANSSAVRLRVFDNYFGGTVITNASWVSDRTRFERNYVTSNFTQNSNNWDFRGNVFAGTTTDSGTGNTWDSSTTFATPSIALGTAAAAGTATTVIRSDSTIVAFSTAVPVTQAYNDAASAGTAAYAARRDHVHGMPASGGIGELLIVDTGASTPLIFADILQNEAEDDLLYGDP